MTDSTDTDKKDAVLKAEVTTAPVLPPPLPQWPPMPEAHLDVSIDNDAYEQHDEKPPPNLGRSPRMRSGVIDENSVYRLIDLKRSISTIELTLTAITIAVIILKISFSELSTQISSLISGGSARTLLDVSVAVGFIAIVVATLQIPRHFTDALIYSNQDTMRILLLVGAQPKFVAGCFARVVLKSMTKALGQGLVATALLYLLISEVAQLWVPVTRTYFLREVAEAVAAIIVFAGVAYFMVRRKVTAFYRRGSQN